MIKILSGSKKTIDNIGQAEVCENQTCHATIGKCAPTASRLPQLLHRQAVHKQRWNASLSVCGRMCSLTDVGALEVSGVALAGRQTAVVDMFTNQTQLQSTGWYLFLHCSHCAQKLINFYIFNRFYYALKLGWQWTESVSKITAGKTMVWLWTAKLCW